MPNRRLPFHGDIPPPPPPPSMWPLPDYPPNHFDPSVLPPPPPSLIPHDNPSWPRFDALATGGSQSPISDDGFSVVDDSGTDDPANVVQEFHEGPKTCQCCINWQEGVPEGQEEVAIPEPESDDDEGCPILIRRVLSGGGSRLYKIHCIEIHSAPLRALLADVFQGYDGVVRSFKHLIFMAPFHQFFWRWNEFERAIKEQEDESLLKPLKMLRRIVKSELGNTFTLNKEMLSHKSVFEGMVWTLFKPGELVYSKLHGNDQLFRLHSVVASGSYTSLQCHYIEWNGHKFGIVARSIEIPRIFGTKKITDLVAFPASYLDDFEGMKKRMIQRGQRFQELAGIAYKAYRHPGSPINQPTVDGKVDRRIIIDAANHPTSCNYRVYSLYDECNIAILSGLIRQSPLNPIEPPGGHIPIPRPLDNLNQHFIQAGLPPPPHQQGMPVSMPPLSHPVAPYCVPIAARTQGHLLLPPPPPGPNSLANEMIKPDLSDFQLMLCSSQVRGFDLREKEWAKFNVNCVEDIAWNREPFDSLVLPDGYKDLILAFVESQLKTDEVFDDIINGKGGGTVVLLSGSPGVGKTLTAESVAERIQAPLYKMELGSESTKRHVRKSGKARSRSVSIDSESEDEGTFMSVEQEFELAARWNAVLLIDECDTYLEKRSDNDPRRNRIVSSFLQKLEYYPSLLFLTTNRPGVLDAALASRIHLTINYPALDPDSRLKIWRMFLTRAKMPTWITEEETRVLAGVDLDGRRIKNVVRAASIMASRDGRGLEFDDIKKVLRIVEGIKID